MVPPHSHKIPRVSCYSGYRPLRFTSFTGFSPSLMAAFHPPFNSLASDSAGPYPSHPFGYSVWAFPRSLATTYGITFCFLFLRVLRCFSSPRVPSSFDDTYASVVCGFPHSEIRASSVICTYTRLIAACHVLHRLPVPGHSPCALSSLTFVSTNVF